MATDKQAETTRERHNNLRFPRLLSKIFAVHHSLQLVISSYCPIKSRDITGQLSNTAKQGAYKPPMDKNLQQQAAHELPLPELTLSDGLLHMVILSQLDKLC